MSGHYKYPDIWDAGEGNPREDSLVTCELCGLIICLEQDNNYEPYHKDVLGGVHSYVHIRCKREEVI